MWARILNVIIGLWLTISPQVLNLNKATGNAEHILGPVIAAIAVTSASEVVRNVRFFNILTGAALLIIPWALPGSSTTATVNNILCGILVILFSLVKGRIENCCGGGWRSLFKPEPEHAQEAQRLQERANPDSPQY